MTEQKYSHGARHLNANLAGFILILNFAVFGGVILVMTSFASPQPNREAEAVVAHTTASVTAPSATVTQSSEPTLTAIAPQTEALVTEESLITGDAANGNVLFNMFQPAASFACATCHYVDREDRLIGPGLLNVSVRAESRVPGIGVYDYLYASIVNPGDFVVPDYPDGLMPRNWTDIYSEDEIDDLIAYLMTLR